jgi:hypothetical protein
MHRAHHHVFRFSIAPLVFLVLGSAYAQDTGSIAGTVSAPTCWGPVPAGGVLVVMDDWADVAVTADDGSYFFDDVQEGDHTLGYYVGSDPHYYGQVRKLVGVVADQTSVVDVLLPFWAPDHIIVGLIAGSTFDDAQALADTYGLTLRAYWPDLNAAIYIIPDYSFLQDEIDILEQDPLVRYAEPDGYGCANSASMDEVRAGPEPSLADQASEHRRNP